mmetsp:Transcript_13421/g.15376  ORF Transcript_13421/g.15376 Transcript_13421/m.15376 type:complete len:181 (+) Transcript_13421:27-569(+)
MDSQLLDNIEKQTKRLIQQLQEIEELKDELDAEEYQSSKEDTVKQLREFQQMLENAKDLTLMSKVDKQKQEIENAIKSSFNQDKLKETLSSGEVTGIRDRIKKLDQDFTLKRMKQADYITETLKLINQLEALKIQLSPDEKGFLDKYTGSENFVDADKEKKDVKDELITEAKKQVDMAKK